MNEPKKKITIVLNDDIAEEFVMQLKDWVSDFYCDESTKVEIGLLE